MPTFTITNTTSGVIVGDYEGQTADAALDAMAVDAGYADYADLLARVPGATRDELDVSPTA